MMTTVNSTEPESPVQRSGGILMHISSLPGGHGIGAMGHSARQWVDFLEETGTVYWQILPLNPTGYGNSPYQGLSAFAGNPLFINLEDLCENGWLSREDLAGAPKFPLQKVNFPRTTAWKFKLLRRAFERFRTRRQPHLSNEFGQFKHNTAWLQDFTLFMALREAFNQVSWSQWPLPLRLRDAQALADFSSSHSVEVDFQTFLQFLFFRQWQSLKEYANSHGVLLIGDIPIFMGFDSAEVWAQPHLFQLDADRQPLAVAGVPPDFFSATGQLWGNPLYDWQAHKQNEYDWWVSRVSETLKTVDLIRLDHFRGFAGYYRIPAGAATAEHGEWVDGPGSSLFDTLQARLGSLPFIAEDLGIITPDVVALREKYQFPGMRILQFAFSNGTDNAFLPHNYPSNCVAYTGTHDNATSIGWFKNAPEPEKSFCASYLGHHTQDIAREMIRTVWQSHAQIAIAPMQDFLRLGTWARMNMPATIGANWQWRMKPGAINDPLDNWVREINTVYDRAQVIN